MSSVHKPVNSAIDHVGLSGRFPGQHERGKIFAVRVLGCRQRMAVSQEEGNRQYLQELELARRYRDGEVAASKCQHGGHERDGAQSDQRPEHESAAFDWPSANENDQKMTRIKKLRIAERVRSVEEDAAALSDPVKEVVETANGEGDVVRVEDVREPDRRQGNQRHRESEEEEEEDDEDDENLPLQGRVYEGVAGRVREDQTDSSGSEYVCPVKSDRYVK